MSVFSLDNIPQLPPDPLFGLKARFSKDSRSDKVDLGIGAYRDDKGKPWVLPSIRAAEKLLQNDPNYNHEYLGIAGLPEFTSAAARIIFGDDSPALKESRVLSVQSLSGTGALHIAGVFLKQFYSASNTVYLSNPTWANHKQIFENVGLKIASYPYWDASTKSLDLEGFLSEIEKAPKGSIFLLHSCAHNPTGLDPTPEQWDAIIDAIAKNNHFALIDSAYQGFASGSLENDALAVRKAVNHHSKMPILLCQSFAKNCGMYGERVGAIHMVLHEQDDKLKSAILSQLQKIVRSEISNPPAYGAKVVTKVLQTPELMQQWQKDMETMSSRITSMRKELRRKLEGLGTPGTWAHITEQQGMFSFTGLTTEQVSLLEQEHAVYLVSSGRASVAGLNAKNVEKVAQAIDDVVRKTHSKL